MRARSRVLEPLEKGLLDAATKNLTAQLAKTSQPDEPHKQAMPWALQEWR